MMPPSHLLNNSKLWLSIGLHILIFCLLLIVSDKKPLPNVEPHLTAHILDASTLTALTQTTLMPSTEPPSQPIQTTETKPTPTHPLPHKTITAVQTPQQPVAISTKPFTPPNYNDMKDEVLKSPVTSKTAPPPSSNKLTIESKSAEISASEDPFNSGEAATALKKTQAAARRAEIDSLIAGAAVRIQQKVRSNWPVRSEDVGLQAKVRIMVLPGGEVQSAVIIKSSGQSAFDSNLKSAIYNSSPLPVPSDREAFNKMRREGLELTFTATDR